MNLFNSNMNLLKRRFPYLHDMILSYSSNTLHYSAEISRSGDPTLQINGTYIHSKFDPRREASRFISGKISPEAGIVIFAGLGLGYHAEEFIRIDNVRDIIIVEPDIDLFILALHERELSSLIQCSRVRFLIGGEPEDCSLFLEQHPGKIVQLIILRSLYSIKQTFYEHLEIFIQNYASRKEINLSTLKRFGKLWVRNLSENARQLADAPGINTLKDLLSSYPALLIAAGPSLDQVKPHLKELQKRFLTIAVDTSLRACIDAGIEPDFTVVVDPQYWNSRHLDRCKTNKTILLSETSTYPTVFRQITGKTFLCSSSFPLGLYLEEKTEIKGKLKAGGSVATAAWDFCRTLNIDDIWCTGLDLGFPGKQTHCRGSFFEQRAHWLSERVSPSETFSWHALNDAGLSAVESNSGTLTWTDKRMSVYSRWFEEQMLNYKNIRSWNLSEGGIKIQGMPKKFLKEALEKPIIRDDLNDALKTVLQIQTPNSLLEKLDAAMNELLAGLRHLKGLSEVGLKGTQSLKIAFENREDLQPYLDKLTELDEKIIKSVSKDIAGFILQNFISGIIRDNSEKKGVEIINNSINLYRELHNSVLFHLNLLEKTQ